MAKSSKAVHAIFLKKPTHAPPWYPAPEPRLPATRDARLHSINPAELHKSCFCIWTLDSVLVSENLFLWSWLAPLPTCFPPYPRSMLCACCASFSYFLLNFTSVLLYLFQCISLPPARLDRPLLFYFFYANCEDLTIVRRDTRFFFIWRMLLLLLLLLRLFGALLVCFFVIGVIRARVEATGVVT